MILTKENQSTQHKTCSETIWNTRTCSETIWNTKTCSETIWNTQTCSETIWNTKTTVRTGLGLKLAFHGKRPAANRRGQRKAVYFMKKNFISLVFISHFRHIS